MKNNLKSSLMSKLIKKKNDTYIKQKYLEQSNDTSLENI